MTAESYGLTSPVHGWVDLVREMGARVQTPSGLVPSHVDRLGSRLIGRPEHWAMARRLLRDCSGDELLLCSGEDVGVPLALIAGRRRLNVRICIFSHNLDRPRARLALGLVRQSEVIVKWLTVSEYQRQFLIRYLGLSESKATRLPEQVDTEFWTPGTPSPGKKRPVVVCTGVERRDYATLAQACATLNVDLRVSAHSFHADSKHQGLPARLPANMDARYYSWTDLRQLYRDADLVAISLSPCRYAAGLTTLLEAGACGRPILLTNTVGMSEWGSPQGILHSVPPCDARGLRCAIGETLRNAPAASEAASILRGHILESHSRERWVRAARQSLALS